MRMLVVFALLAVLICSSCKSTASPVLLLNANSLPTNSEKSHYLKVGTATEAKYKPHEREKPLSELPPELGFLMKEMRAQAGDESNFAVIDLEENGQAGTVYMLHWQNVAYTPYLKIVTSKLTEPEVVALVRKHYSSEHTAIVEWQRNISYIPRFAGLMHGRTEYSFEVPSQKLLVSISSVVQSEPDKIESAWRIDAAKLR